MIAQRAFVEESPAPFSRAARGAAQRRRARTARMRYALGVRIAAIVGALTLLVVVYLGLVGNVERMNYEQGVADGERAKLVAQSEKLEDALARLRSRERLATIAAQLGMHEPQRFASITLPPEHAQPPATGLAFLPRLR
jgi:hypothetical protein